MGESFSRREIWHLYDMGESFSRREIWHLYKHKYFDIFRKHSSGDLHSRLKTRKLLGVGETDDGDVHRSKVK